MKKLITLLAIAAALVACVSLGVAAEVRLANTGNVYVDGSNAGQPADVIANNPALAPAVQAALVAFVVKTSTLAAAEITAAQKASADAIAANAAELAAAKARIATLEPALAERDARLTASAAYIATLQKALRDAGQPVPPPAAPSP